jgi:hypothetical protein
VPLRKANENCRNCRKLINHQNYTMNCLSRKIAKFYRTTNVRSYADGWESNPLGYCTTRITFSETECQKRFCFILSVEFFRKNVFRIGRWSGSIVYSKGISPNTVNVGTSTGTASIKGISLCSITVTKHNKQKGRLVDWNRIGRR